MPPRPCLSQAHPLSWPILPPCFTLFPWVSSALHTPSPQSRALALLLPSVLVMREGADCGSPGSSGAADLRGSVAPKGLYLRRRGSTKSRGISSGLASGGEVTGISLETKHDENTLLSLRKSMGLAGLSDLAVQKHLIQPLLKPRAPQDELHSWESSVCVQQCCTVLRTTAKASKLIGSVAADPFH